MVARSITEELAIAVPAELLWKAALATGDESSMRNFLTGLIDVDVKIDGDGGPGSRYTLKFKPGTVRTVTNLAQQGMSCNLCVVYIHTAVGAAMVVIKSRRGWLCSTTRRA